MLKEFAELIPKSMLHKSGEVFFSGRRAFGLPSELYVLGANPGGAPEGMQDSTVSRHIEQVFHDKPANWSAYRDESWHGRARGKSPMQRGVLHLFKKIGIDPGEAPCSEVVFLRSRSLPELKGNYEQLAAQCWPFHQAVINRLGVRVVVCLGKTAGISVRRYLKAYTQTDEFVEKNKRKWESLSHKNDEGMFVVTLTHPSQVAWTSPASDPTSLVKRALIRTDTKHRDRYLARRRNFNPIRIEGGMISDTVIRDRETGFDYPNGE